MEGRTTRWSGAVVAAALLAAILSTVPGAAPVGAAQCPDTSTLAVPGAELQQVSCLDDLTTLSNRRTDTNGVTGAGTRGNGSLHATATDLPADAVPGVQIEGWFADTCDHWQPETASFMPRCDNGLRRNGQFVLRIPNDWDGQHLVVVGAPGVRTQFSSDIIVSDFVLTRGWAYAAHDKGNTGLNFFRAGDDEVGDDPARWIPGRAIEQWAGFMETTAAAAESVLDQLHGSPPSLTYAAGISNGGYQVRRALELYPDRFDAGLDWEGTLLRPEAPNLLSHIPHLLRNYERYKGGDPAAYDAMVHDGRVPPDSQPIWDNHWSVYWGLVASTYRPVFDPEYTQYVAAPREVLSADPDAQYDYEQRPATVPDRIRPVANTGDTSGRPLITLHGTLDALLPIDVHSDVYASMVRDQGHGDAFRYYVIENGNHVDKLADTYPDLFQPILPCFHDALDALDAWVVDGTAPPPSGFVPFAAHRTAEQRANACDLPPPVDRVGGADRVATSAAAARGAFGTSETVVIASAGDFPDALAAAPLAATLGGPVLLVGDAVAPDVLRELDRTGAVAAVVVGGPAAVSDEVVAELEAAGLAVRRVAGADRYGTAAAVAEDIGAPTGEAIVASGERFPDALSVAPLGAAAGTPILLTRAASLPEPTAAALQTLGVERTLLIGGPAAVGEDVADALPEPARVAGVDRYATSVAVAALAVERGHSLEQVGIATGRDFADALSAGPVMAAGYGGAPPRGVTLLVDGTDPDGARAAAAFLAPRIGAVGQLLVFGGTAAVADDVVASLPTPAGATDDDDGMAGEPPSPPSGATVGTTFPDGFDVPADASLGVPVIGFGAAGAVTRTPVVLLHGNNDTPYPTSCNGAYGKVQAFAQHLVDAGYALSEVWALGYQGEQCDLATNPPNRSGEAHSTAANVPDLRAFVAEVLDFTGAQQVDVIGHSLGATLVREWLRQDDAYGRVRRVVSVDGPHHGILNCSPNPRNYWQQPVLGGFHPDSAICLEYGADDTPLLAALNAGDERPGPTEWMAIANEDTSFVFIEAQDGVVPPVPAEDRHGQPHDFSPSALLDGAETLLVTGQGAYDDVLRAAHTGIVNSPDVWAAAAEFLSTS